MQNVGVKFVIFVIARHSIGIWNACLLCCMSLEGRPERRQEGPIMRKRKARKCNGEAEAEGEGEAEAEAESEGEGEGEGKGKGEAEAEAEGEEDRIVWPPCVIVENTRLCKTPDGRWTGLGNPEMACFLAGHP